MHVDRHFITINMFANIWGTHQLNKRTRDSMALIYITYVRAQIYNVLYTLVGTLCYWSSDFFAFSRNVFCDNACVVSAIATPHVFPNPNMPLMMGHLVCMYRWVMIVCDVSVGNYVIVFPNHSPTYWKRQQLVFSFSLAWPSLAMRMESAMCWVDRRHQPMGQTAKRGMQSSY